MKLHVTGMVFRSALLLYIFLFSPIGLAAEVPPEAFLFDSSQIDQVLESSQQVGTFSNLGKPSAGAAGGENIATGVEAAATAASTVDRLADTALVPNEEAKVQINSGIFQISRLKGPLAISGLPLLMSGHKVYMQAREECQASQLRAQTFCMEETNPNMQSSIQNINMILAGVQTVAVKDACSKMAKAMQIAQVGITGYTLACGAMKKTCDVACGKAQTALMEIKKGLGMPATPGMGTPEAVTAAMTAYKAAATQVMQGVTSELNPAMPGKKTIARNVKICGASYTKLLLSAGLGLVSVINANKQAKNCEKDTDALATAENTATYDGSTDSGHSQEMAVAKPMQEGKSMALNAGLVNPQPSMGHVLPANSETNDPIAPQKTRAEMEQDRPLRAYLPGGSKAAVIERKTAGVDEQWRKEVTGAHGPSNFTKMKSTFNRYRGKLIEQ